MEHNNIQDREDKNRKFYDEAFTEIFSNKKIIQSLLVDFIGENWVNKIDFDSMTVKKSQFKGIRPNKKESDLLLKFKIKDTDIKELNLFILLEFQSTPDDMSLRLLEYLHRIYLQNQAKNKLKLLSPVIPIVIYNGKRKWYESPDFIAQFHPFPKDIKPYLPLFKYILIDISHYDEALLKKIRDNVSWFFRIDKTDFKNMKEAAEKIIALLKEMEKADPEIFDLLKSYISGLLSYKGLDNKLINDYIEERRTTMLAESFDALIDEGIEKGIVKGLAKGRNEGIALGEEKKEQKIVTKMLEEGFDIKMIQHITGMTLQQISELSKNLKKNKES